MKKETQDLTLLYGGTVNASESNNNNKFVYALVGITGVLYLIILSFTHTMHPLGTWLTHNAHLYFDVHCHLYPFTL